MSVIHPPLLEAQRIRKTYVSGRTLTLGERQVVVAVDDVSLTLATEEAVGLVGESGSGKSTTGRMLLGLERPSSGAVLFEGEDIQSLKGDAWRRYRASVQSVFQDPWSSLNPRRRIGASISEPLIHLTDLGRPEVEARVAETLELVGLSSDMRNQYPHELSGGMRQRVSIARAIAPWPACIVLDEPVSSLDVSIKAQVMNLLRDLTQKIQVSYILIAHDLATVRFLTDRVVVLSAGKVVELAQTTQVFRNPLHPITKRLLAASKAKSIHHSDSSSRAIGTATTSPRAQSPESSEDQECARCTALGVSCGSSGSGLLEVEAGHFVACVAE